MSDHLKVVQLNEGRPPLNDVPGRLRLLADQIDAGELGDVGTALVIIPQDGDYPQTYGFGDIEGQNDPIIICELAKMQFLQMVMRRV